MRIMSLNHNPSACMLSVQISGAFMSDSVAVSFEFFPPSEEPRGRQVGEALQRRPPLEPNFVSVTYGADGSTRSRTHECVQRILKETDLLVAPHLPCVGATRAEVIGIAQ